MPTRADPTPFRRSDDQAVDWAIGEGLTPYPAAVDFMERRAQAIAEGRAPELVWLVEHPPLYTAGVSAKPADLIDPDRLPVFASGRGGQYTYHGPGQRVAYLMLDLRARGRDVRAFVGALEAWIIAALERLGVRGETRAGRVGIWVSEPGEPGREAKIAAIGVKVRRWVSFHGVSLNVDPDLDHFTGIVPCGLREHGVASLASLGAPCGMAEADTALRAAFDEVFGPSRTAPCA